MSPNQKLHFTFWIKFGLSPKFGLSERLIQKVKSPPNVCAAKALSQQNLRRELDSSLRRCQEFIDELQERSEMWPFRRPVSRREVSDVGVLI